MALTYRRPGVYIEESLLSSTNDISGATSVACFVGAAAKGPANEPVLIESWGEYVAQFGGFSTVKDPATAGVSALSYLPYSVYQYFQNGGRQVFIIRATPTASGTASSKVVTGTTFADALVAGNAFTLTAKSSGVWGQNLSYGLRVQSTYVGSGAALTDVVFTLQILLTTGGISEVVETFPNVTMAGTIEGTRSVVEAVNDLVSGSKYVTISAVTATKPADTTAPVPFTGGTDPNLPAASDLVNAAKDSVSKMEGPIILNIAGYLSDATKADTTTWADVFIGTTVSSTDFPDRRDIFVVNDNTPPREAGTSNSVYKTTMISNSTLGASLDDSYSASYGPWVIIPNPLRSGSVMAVPPGGSVIGMMARIDSTIGVFRAPAGVIATLNNVVGVQTKFTDGEQGDLNSLNINLIRSVVGAGIAVMGARTRKSFGADKYVNQRRTLIYIREVLRRSTQFAVFENNDERLWSALRMAADRILRPLWEAGGLRGSSAAEAYFIRSDDSINTPGAIAAGEVRMEVGVATEYPAEFVIIRITQFDRGVFTAEVQPSA